MNRLVKPPAHIDTESHAVGRREMPDGRTGQPPEFMAGILQTEIHVAVFTAPQLRVKHPDRKRGFTTVSRVAAVQTAAVGKTLRRIAAIKCLRWRLPVAAGGFQIRLTRPRQPPRFFPKAARTENADRPPASPFPPSHRHPKKAQISRAPFSMPRCVRTLIPDSIFATNM